MASINCEITFDSDGFRAALMRRIALTDCSDENIERIAINLINTGDFVHIGPEVDILDAEFIGL